MTMVSKNSVYSLISGLLMAFSWPTYGFPFLMFVAWVPLLLIEHEMSLEEGMKRKSLKIFAWSYLTFFIFNIIAIHWLWRVEVNKVGAFVPTIILNALLMSVFFLFYHRVKKNIGTIGGLIALPLIWIVFEKMHLEWELNWPWLNLGNAFADYPKWIQWYSLTGTLGGTIWVLAINSAIFYYYKIYLVTRKKHYFQRIGFILLVGIGIPSVLSWIMYYQFEETGEEVEVLLLQPEVDPYQEKYEKTALQLAHQLADLMKKAAPSTPLIVGPETALPGRGGVLLHTISTDPILELARAGLPNSNSLLVTGMDVVEMVNQEGKDVNFDTSSGQYYKRYNAAVQLDGKGNSQMYVKSKLVPMVEYFSYQNLIMPLLGETMIDFGGSTSTLSRPLEPKVFTNEYNTIKVAPTVCYESVFGEYTSEFVKQGANLITISTNDSWWQDSQGHKQLLAYARLRAIENRRYIARSANSGISAFIDPRGEIISQLPYLYEGVLSDKVQLLEKQTYYTRHGDYLARIAFLLVGILLGYIVAIRLKKYLP